MCTGVSQKWVPHRSQAPFSGLCKGEFEETLRKISLERMVRTTSVAFQWVKRGRLFSTSDRVQGFQSSVEVDHGKENLARIITKGNL